MNILISGGHLTPALAFIDYIQQQTDDKVVFVGRLYSQDATQQRSQEQTEIEQRQIPFLPFQAVRIRKQESFIQRLSRPFAFTHSVIQALSIMVAHKPDVFLSFGGYLAVPLAIAAWIKNIPIITHEQTRTSGFANQFIGLLATNIALSFPDSHHYFQPHKTVLTGNPIRSDILKKETTRPSWIDHAPTKPLLLITCGNQGSHAINLIIGEILLQLTQDWTVVHLAGNPTTEIDYVSHLTKLKQQLPLAQQHNYYVHTWTNGTDLAWLYTHAAAAIARSGANTVQELATRRIPSLFIPLPFAHRNEQFLNAQALADQKAALILTQDNLTSERLLETVQQLKLDRELIQRNLKKLSFPTNGDHRLYQLVAAAHYAK
jgi:UDP-N-acetylglucosamine--N-acetylmuramyl-(pentapeptide) pyrophosphoryl-undecaprenol N-acetylglucosamine transferase